jgi:anti-sigma28 factor (negative regulator of flagellin synthesis)
MRIDSKLDITPITTEGREAPERTPAKAESSVATVVSLSPAGARAAAAAGRAQSGQTTRLEKIKAMIDAGDYPVDLDKLAERIADDELVRTRRS